MTFNIYRKMPFPCTISLSNEREAQQKPGEGVVERLSQLHKYTILCCDVAQDLIRMASDEIQYFREERKRNDANGQGQLYKRLIVLEGSLVFKDKCSCVCALPVIMSDNS